MRLPLIILFAAVTTTAIMPACLRAQAVALSETERAALHQGPAWTSIAPHLPNMQTATPAQLETAGDVLRARRFPEDALDYYQAAIDRGGNVTELLNRMGVVRLELRQTTMAHELFHRVVAAQRKNAEGWNNLGASSYALHDYREAIGEYRHAEKLTPHSAVVHSNLAMAYFQNKDIESAQRELTRALAIDPRLMDRNDTGGTSLQVLGVEDYGNFCMQMARVYVRRGDLPNMVLWLGKASEAGEDLRYAMRDDPRLMPYLKLTQVQMYIHNAQEMRKSAVAMSKTAPIASQPVKYD